MEKPNLYLLGILAIYLMTFLSVGLSLKSIPSCLLGCDFYFEQGNVLHMAEDFNLASSSSTHLGHLSQGPQLYFMIASIPVRLGLDVVQTSMLLSMILIAFSFFIYFRLFEKIFGHWKVGLLCALFAFRLTTFPIFKYTEFSIVFSIPLFLYVFNAYIGERNLKNAALLGIATGIMGLTHASTFFIAYIFIASYVIVNIIISKNLDSIRSEWKGLLAAGLIGFLISLQWWYVPIFVYHGSAYLGFGFNTYYLADMGVYLGFLIQVFTGLFLNFSSLFGVILSLINIAGVYIVYLQIKENRLRPEIAYFLMAFIIAVFHFILTSPLLGKDLSPQHSLRLLSPILGAFLVGLIFEDEKRRKYLIPLAVAVLIFNVTGFLEKPNDRFFGIGLHPLPDQYLQLQSWIRNNTEVNDVFLSTNELCFALNGLSGRKCLIIRRSHCSKFDEMDSSYLAAAIILYGNDTSEKVRLLRENNVSYLYWDTQWVNTEYYADQAGNIGFYDPITIMYSPEREQELIDNGVVYDRAMAWLEPSMRDDRFKKYDVLFVSPDNYYNFSHPWKPDLDPYLQKVWSYGENAVVYKVVTGS